MRARGSGDGQGILLRVEISLQLANPIGMPRVLKTGIFAQACFISELVEVMVREARQLRRESAHRSQERHLRSDEIDHVVEVQFARELQGALGFLQYLPERLTGTQQHRNQQEPRIAGESQIAALL